MLQLPTLIFTTLGVLCFYAAPHCRGWQFAQRLRDDRNAAARFEGASIGCVFGGCTAFSMAFAWALGVAP